LEAATPVDLNRVPASALAMYLDDHDVLALSGVNRQFLAALAPERRAIRIAHHEAPAVETLADFRRVLDGGGDPAHQAHSIAALPPALRGAPLIALGARLARLPAQDLDAAADRFLAHPVPQELAHDTLLQGLRESARGGAAALRTREAQLVAQGGAAHEAVLGGGTASGAARRFGLAGDQATRELDALALPRARAAIDSGAAVPDAVRQAGLMRPDSLAGLQRHATDTHGLPAVARGEPPEQVAARLGIDDQGQIRALNHGAARYAVTTGTSVPEVAHRFAMNGGDALRGLEMHAAQTFGRQAVSEGQGVGAVMGQLGITLLPGLRLQLEAAAVDLVGLDAVRRGESVASVVDRLDILSDAQHQRLADAAADLPPMQRRRMD
jgi:hypothetical protein